MSATASPTVAPHPGLRVLARRGLARRPEAWLYAVAAGAGLALLLPVVTPGQAPSVPAHHHGLSSPGATGAGSLLNEWGEWILMVLVMMLPIVAPHARRVAMRSLWHRRQRGIALFLVGYLAVWLAIGAVLVAVLAAIGQPHSGPVVPAATLLGAAAWQVSRPRRRVLRRCGTFRPAAIRGWQADSDCASAGFRLGLRCAFTCGPVMLVMAVAHSVILTGALLALLLSERARGPNPDRRAGRPLEAWCLVAFAAAFSVVGIAS